MLAPAASRDDGDRPASWRSLGAVFAYGGTARDLVLRFKHGRAFALARPLGTLMAAVAARDGMLDGEVLVVPVPAWPARARKRRYSPPARLAVEIGCRTALPVDPRVLVRVRPPVDESHAGPRQRTDRVKGAFAIARPATVRGRPVLLVDDVVASGATAREIARLLRAAGATRVDVIAAAIAVEPGV